MRTKNRPSMKMLLAKVEALESRNFCWEANFVELFARTDPIKETLNEHEATD